MIGTVYTELPILSVIADGDTPDATISVTGVTMPSNIVTLYVDGTPATTVKANRAGDYYATVTLSPLSDGKRYTILAEAEDGYGNPITAETRVVYRETTPTMTSFVMEHNGQTFNMNQLRGTKPTVSFAPGRTFKFTVKFDRISSIRDVYVVSTRNNTKKYLRAIWDNTSNAFIAEGFFDEDNTSYVPGTISIEYTRNSGTVSFTDGYDFISASDINSLPKGWENADVVDKSTEDRTDITIKAPDSEASVHVISETREIPKGLTESNAVSKGYTKVTDSNGHSVYVKKYTDPCKFSYDYKQEVADFVYGKYYDYCIDGIFGTAGGALYSTFEILPGRIMSSSIFDPMFLP